MSKKKNKASSGGTIQKEIRSQLSDVPSVPAPAAQAAADEAAAATAPAQPAAVTAPAQPAAVMSPAQAAAVTSPAQPAPAQPAPAQPAADAAERLGASPIAAKKVMLDPAERERAAASVTSAEAVRSGEHMAKPERAERRGPDTIPSLGLPLPLAGETAIAAPSERTSQLIAEAATDAGASPVTAPGFEPAPALESGLVPTELGSAPGFEAPSQEAGVVPEPEPAAVQFDSGSLPETPPFGTPETMPDASAPEPQPDGEAAPQAEPMPAQAPSVQAVSPMYVVHLTPEFAPVAKVGGLGDVVFGLSRELQLRGNTVEIILPKYDCMRYDHIFGLERCYEDLWVPWHGGAIHCSVYSGFVYGRKCYFIEPHSGDNFFNRGTFYGCVDDLMRFAFFTRAAMEFLYKSGKRPEIIHCHDWQTALAPVLLYEIYQHIGMHHPRVCLTIHNFRHQGLVGDNLLSAMGLGRHLWAHEKLRDNTNHQMLNLMKGGIVYSNFVTTVSPHHAWEAQHGQGFGLDSTLHVHQGKYGGVLNGIDYDHWNPEVDRHIPSNYGLETLEKKYENKRALRQRLWLADGPMPIVSFVGRLDPQKGLDLVRHSIFHALGNGAQYVLLGTSPDGKINGEFWNLKRHLNDSPHCHLEIGFDEELSHLIYAGSDIMVVPSRYEPCGLTQLIAMKYGTVPVVRKVGGLADSVFDKDHDDKPLHERNGYVFEHYSNAALDWALNRAIRCYYDFPDHFRHLIANGMRADYSWNHPGRDYVNIYDMIRSR